MDNQTILFFVIALAGLIAFEFYTGAPTIGKFGKDHPVVWSIGAGFHLAIFLSLTKAYIQPQFSFLSWLDSCLSPPSAAHHSEIVLPAVVALGGVSWVIRKRISSLKNEDFSK